MAWQHPFRAVLVRVLASPATTFRGTAQRPARRPWKPPWIAGVGIGIETSPQRLRGAYAAQAISPAGLGGGSKNDFFGLDQADAPLPWASGLGPSKLLKSITAQGISPAGLDEFRQQWRQGRKN